MWALSLLMLTQATAKTATITMQSPLLQYIMLYPT
jgi:hypothetical protein